MQQDIYTPEQEKAFQEVTRLVWQLRKIEHLQEVAYSAVIGLEGALKQTVADISLDNLPKYFILEENLKKSITTARGIGLSENPYIKEIGRLAFS